MVDFPPGRRWETSYAVRIFDKSLSELGRLESVHRLRGKQALYGMYGCTLTFSLQADDPWAAILNQDELHFCQVLRDGTAVFDGMQLKKVHDDKIGEDQEYIEFAFEPLDRLLFYRVGIPIAPATTLATTDYIDDAFKWVVERTAGPTAPASPTNAVARAYSNFSVAANKTEHPTSQTMNATAENIYEWLQKRGFKYEVDWAVRFDSSDHPEYETWYPRRGTDRSEGNGVVDEVIFSDDWGNIVRQNYGHTAPRATMVIDAPMTTDVIASADDRSNWWVRETRIPRTGGDALDTELAAQGVKETYRLVGFQERANAQWLTDFYVGDKVTWYSTRLGFGPVSDTICGITFEIDSDGFEHLGLEIGKPEPDMTDRLRGGGKGADDPDYTRWVPVLAKPAFTFGAAAALGASWQLVHSDSVIELGIYLPDTNTVYPDDEDHNEWDFTSTDGTVTMTANGDHGVDFSADPPAAHTHGLTYTPTASGAGAAHTHAMSGSAAAGAAHTHAISGATAAGAAHNHGLSGSSAAGSAHSHGVSGNTDAGSAHNHDLDGETDTWSTPYDVSYATGKNNLRQVGGTVVYMEAGTGHLTTTAAGNTELLIGEAKHKHPLSGGDADAHTENESAHTHAVTGVSTDNESAHTHDAGTYAIGNESTHTHAVGTLANANESAHTHAIGSIAAANESTHTHDYDKTDTPTGGVS